MQLALSRARLGSLALLLAVTASCSDDKNDNTTTAPTAPPLTLSETVVTLVRTAATPNPTKQVNIDPSGAAVTWSAGDPSVATISPTGLITGKGDGTTFFTARLQSDPTVNRSVVVKVVSTIVAVNPASTFTWVGGPSRTFTSTVTNNPVTTVTWSSSNTSVATVSNTGVVTPVGAGTATITATSTADPGKSAFSTITVDPAPVTTATLITSGTPLTNLSAAAGADTYYRIEVPQGATKLVVTTTGATSDLDLFVQAGTPPKAAPSTAADYTSSLPVKCVAATNSGNETCTIDNPQARVYYIMLDAFEAYSKVTLTATVSGP